MIGRRLGISLAVASFVLFAIGSYAVAGPRDGPGKVPDSKKFEARLNGFQETPSVSTTGFGNFEAELVNADEAPLRVHTTRGSRAEHRSSRTCTSASGASPAASRSSSAAAARSRPSVPGRRGHVEGDITPADVVGPNGQGIEPGSFGEIIRAMQAGQSYANIHTTRWPGGEIRGQINDKDQKEFDK